MKSFNALKQQVAQQEQIIKKLKNEKNKNKNTTK